MPLQLLELGLVLLLGLVFPLRGPLALRVESLFTLRFCGLDLVFQDIELGFTAESLLDPAWFRELN